MFGYITPAADALSKEDRRLFRAYYCAVCRKIGKLSQVSRLFLTYDSAFLALLLDSLLPEDPRLKPAARCIMHPTKAMPPLPDSVGVDYAAEMNVILLRGKLADDIRDEKKRGAALLLSILPEASRGYIDKTLSELSEIEERGVKAPDLAADCFAKLCEALFTPDFTEEKNRAALGQLGYNIGRWIYLADACEDFEKDKKSGGYNPYESLSGAEEDLYFTLSRGAAAFDLLEIKRYRSLLENIIYAGLSAKTHSIFHGGKDDK